jgi:hypothetical protein
MLADARRQSCTGFLVRALRWFKERSIRVERVMSDNRPRCGRSVTEGACAV